MPPGESSKCAPPPKIPKTACIEGAYGVGHARIIIPLIKRCGLIRVHKISLLSLLFLFACHPAQFIPQEASTDGAQPSGGPGTYTRLWRVRKAGHGASLSIRSLNLVLGQTSDTFSICCTILRPRN